MKINMKVVVVAVMAIALLSALPAKADTLSIALQEATVNGGAVTQVASSAAGSAAYSSPGAYGTFSSVNASGQGNPPLVGNDLLNSSTMDVSGTAGSLNVYITSTGNTTPSGLQSLLSDFTSNKINGAWTVTVSSYVNNSDLDPTAAGWAGSAVLVSTATFNGPIPSPGQDQAFIVAATTSSDYSLTTLYQINTNGFGGNANLTADITTPEPSALVLLGAGLLGFAVVIFRRKQVTVQQ